MSQYESEPHWVVEMGSSSPGCLGSAELTRALERAGIPCRAVRRAPFSGALLRPEPGSEAPADLPGQVGMVYGSVAMKRVAQARGWDYFDVPGSDEQRRIWGEEMLNSRAQTAALGQLDVPKQPVFIRPEQADKAFAGQVVTPERFSAWRQDLLDPRWTALSPDLQVCVSTPQVIQGEWRVVITGGEVSSASRYRLRGLFAPEAGAPQDVLDYAQEQAGRWDQPPPVYVMDLCRAGPGAGQLRVMELGALSASGLYQLDLDRVARDTQAALNAHQTTNDRSRS